MFCFISVKKQNFIFFRISFLSQFCLYYLVKFCPHELFVNTRADLGQCTKLHDDEAKRLFDEARPSARKRSYEDEFLRFSNHMINEVDRKIEKGRQRLLLMNKTNDTTPPVYVSKYQEQLNNLNARIKKLIGEAEEAGVRGDVDQAQGLMTLCDQLKEEKEALVANHSDDNGSEKNEKWNEYTSNEKQMEVCEVCGAFLIVGDAQQRIEDHLSGKQHLGYSRLRKAVEEMYEKRKKEREEEDRLRDQDRRHKMDGGGMRGGERRDRDRVDRRRDEFDDRRRSGLAGNRGNERNDRGTFDRERERGDRRRERGDRHGGSHRDDRVERERNYRDNRRK